MQPVIKLVRRVARGAVSIMTEMFPRELTGNSDLTHSIPPTMGTCAIRRIHIRSPNLALKTSAFMAHL